jgi:hypothetical protein
MCMACHHVKRNRPVATASYEVIIWDSRDKDSEHPSSTMATFDTLIDAHEALRAYLKRWPQHVPFIVKTEIVKV